MGNALPRDVELACSVFIYKRLPIGLVDAVAAILQNVKMGMCYIKDDWIKLHLVYIQLKFDESIHKCIFDGHFFTQFRKP